jgi:hypothetical protein
MNKRLILIAVCVTVLTTSAMAFSDRAQLAKELLHWGGAAPVTTPRTQPVQAVQAERVSPQPNQPQQNPAIQTPQGPNTPPPNGVIPQFVVYRQLFRHLIVLDEQASEKERKGDDGSWLRSHYKRQAHLNDDQEAVLKRIARACEQEVSAKDRQAKELIDAAKAAFPGGRIPQGQTPPPLPPELKTLQEERNAIVLRAREQLRAELGEGEFARFDQFVQQNIANRIKPVHFDRPRPEMPDSPGQQAKARKHNAEKERGQR